MKEKLIKSDNPVTSIEDIYKWMETNKDYDKKSYGCLIHKKKTIMLNSLFSMLNKLKQNVVETDNGQPKQCNYAIIATPDTLIGFTDTKDREILDEELGIHPDDYIEFVEVPPVREVLEQLQRG